MKNYLVAVASPFHGTNLIFKCSALTPNEARLQAIIMAGWQVTLPLDETLASIEDLVSEAWEIS